MLQRHQKLLHRTRTLVGDLQNRVQGLRDPSDLEKHRPIYDLLVELRGDDFPTASAPAAGPSDEDLRALAKWFTARGGELQGVVPATGFAEGAGLRAVRAVSAGEAVVKVPASLLFSEQLAGAGPAVAALQGATLMFPEVTLALHLLAERHNPASEWGPYLKSLPRSFSTPLYWSWEELCELRGSAALEDALKCLRSTAEQYAHVFEYLSRCETTERFMSPLTFTFAEYAWAISAVMTRKNRVPRTDGKAKEMLALIPMWDLCNHDPRAQKITTEATEQGSVECRAPLDTPPGEQLMIYYGDRPNMQLLSHNGFVVDCNPNDVVNIASLDMPLPDDKASPAAKLRLKVLRAISRQPAGTLAFFVGLSGEPSEGLASLLRVFSMTDELVLQRWSEEATVKDGMAVSKVDDENEAKAHELLKLVCGRQLAKYPTTLEQDYKLLLPESFQKLSPVCVSALKLRITEKRILAGIVGEVPPAPVFPIIEVAKSSSAQQSEAKQSKGKKKGAAHHSGKKARH